MTTLEAAVIASVESDPIGEEAVSTMIELAKETGQEYWLAVSVIIDDRGIPTTVTKVLKVGATRKIALDMIAHQIKPGNYDIDLLKVVVDKIGILCQWITWEVDTGYKLGIPLY